MNCAYNKNVDNVLFFPAPNTTTYIRQSDNKKININGYIMFYTKRNIKKGEELLFNYELNIDVN